MHCARSWSLAEQGSAGTCFFLLKASQTFQCSGQGQVNMIGAHAVEVRVSFERDILSLRAFGPGGRRVWGVVCMSAHACLRPHPTHPSLLSPQGGPYLSE